MPKGTNSFDIPVFVAGSPLDEQLSASKMNGILDALDILRLRDGRGYTVSYSGPGGTTLDINPGAGFLSQTFPFQLIDVSTEIERRVRVKMGTIADEVPDVFNEGDNPIFYYVVTIAGFVWGEVELNSSGDGTIIEVSISNGPVVPVDTEFLRYVPIGSYNVTPTATVPANFRYGPIIVKVCRNWFSNPPTYGVTFA